MKNIKNLAYAGVWFASVAYTNVVSATAGWLSNQKVPSNSIAQWGNLEDTIQNYLGFLLTFLYIVAVVYGLWWGFNILTAGWDDEKVGKGKKVIINALIGIIVIFIVWEIVKLIFRMLGLYS